MIRVISSSFFPLSQTTEKDSYASLRSIASLEFVFVWRVRTRGFRGHINYVYTIFTDWTRFPNYAGKPLCPEIDSGEKSFSSRAGENARSLAPLEMTR
jgi:hypothetical protein